MTSYQSYDWFISKNFSEYAGKWIAIVDKKVLAVGENPAEVLKKTRSLTTAKPLLTKISDKLRIL